MQSPRSRLPVILVSMFAVAAFMVALALGASYAALAIVGLAGLTFGYLLFQGLGVRSLDAMLFLAVLVTDIGVLRQFNLGIVANPQVAIKLAVAAGCGVIGLVWWRPGRLTREHMMIVAYLAVCAVSVLYSPTRAFSAGACFIAIGHVVLGISLSQRYEGFEDVYRSLFVVWCALATKIVFSWALLALGTEYVFAATNPFVDSRFFGLPRFGGMAGPNTTALNAALACVIGGVLLIQGAPNLRRSLIVALTALSALTLLLTQSRTAILAVFLAFAVVSFYRWRRLFVALCFLSILFAIKFLDWSTVDVLQFASRTGNVEEAATMAGRTAIWAAVIERLGDSPFIGFGYGSGRQIVGALAIAGATRPFHSAHNFVLESMINTGLAGTGLLIVLFAVSFRGLSLRKWPASPEDLGETVRRLTLATLVALFVNGLSESGVSGVLAIPNILCFWLFSLVSSVRALSAHAPLAAKSVQHEGVSRRAQRRLGEGRSGAAGA